MFADMYLPHGSCVTNHISLYRRHFEARGHEVFVFTFGVLDYDDAETGVVRSPGLPWGHTGWRLAAGFSAQARELAETLDIAHVHHPFESGRLVAPIARRCSIPLVFTNHTRYDLYSAAYARFIPQAARYGYLRRSLHDFAERCQLVVAPSPSIASWLREFADSDLVSLIAPRAFMSQTGKGDGIAWWPFVVEEYERSREHYVKLGVEPERMVIDLHEGGHEIRVATGLEFLAKWL